MDIILAILGSSVLSSIITAVFGILQRKKQDTVNYIAEERKNWREKIRVIADNIKNSEFQGEGKKNISEYLLQLQMNINTYGKFDKTDYMHDGHIWEIVDILQCVDNEENFEKNKNLLLIYISLMLKEDWERSKNEVKGYSRILCYVILHLSVSVLIGVYYFLILNLESIWFFVGLVSFSIIFVFYIRVYFIDDIFLLANTKKSLTIKGIIKNQKKFIIKGILLLGVCIIYLLIGSIVIFEILPNHAVKQMKYTIDEDEKLKIYTHLDERVIPDFETVLEKNLNMDIVILHNKTDINIENETRYYDNEIKKILNRQIFVASILVFILFLAEIFLFIYWMMLLNRNQQNLQLENCIIQIRYLNDNQYYKNILSVQNILEKILHMENEELKGEQGKKLFGLEYTILVHTREFLNRKYNIEKKSVLSFEKFEYIEKLEEGLNIIDDCILKLKKAHKKDIEIKRTTINEVEKHINNLIDKGDIYNMDYRNSFNS